MRREGKVPKRLKPIPCRKIIVRVPDYPGGAMGTASDEGVIEIAPDLRGYRRLLVLAHEATHLARWDLTEKEVWTLARRVARVLWRDGYRKEGERR